MTDIELLPLPSVLLNWPHPTNHVAIRDYARANVAHATAAKDAEIERLRSEVERLAEALRWYANPEVYKPHPHGPAFDDRDLSFKARAALRDHDQEGKDG